MKGKLCEEKLLFVLTDRYKTAKSQAPNLMNHKEIHRYFLHNLQNTVVARR